MKGKKTIKILLVVLAVVAAGIIYSCTAKTKTTDGNEPESAVQTETEAIEAEISRRQVCVHICGAVASPGVYYLEEGSRIHEAVDMAGGLLDNAADEYINLAQVISDGQQIYIPDTEEVTSGGFTPPYEPADDGLVNINTASAEELKSIPGIGDIKAEAIVSYRENIASFASIEDIKNVAGIKDSLYEKIKDYIKV